MTAKILVVEDEADTQLALTLRLETSGFAVLHATDVAGAIHIARSAWPDIIVLDLGLPDGNGYGVIKELKASAATSSIPVIVLTGKDPEGNQEHSYELGAIDFFQKPVPYQWFLASVGRALAERPPRRGATVS